MTVLDPTSVLGVSFEAYTKAGLLQRIETAQQPYWIVTANPEILVAGSEDSEYKACLRQADARVVDGFGLWLVLRLRGIVRPRITGGELVKALLTLANTNKWKVALIGGSSQVAQEAAQSFAAAYPNATFLPESAGRVDAAGREDEATRMARERLTAQVPQLWLVAFGHPKQERWLERWRSSFHGAHAMVGVGGVLDVWAGRLLRTPRWLSLLGLEWLWRFWQEPARWRRMWRATGVFLWKVWRES